MSSVLHSLNFGIIFGDNAVSKKPRIMHFDFLSRIIYILHKGQIRDAYPFSDILSCNVLAKPYHLELEVTGAQLIRICFQSHESRDIVFSLLLRISQSKNYDDTYHSTVYMSGVLEKKGNVKWSTRFLSLVCIKSPPNSINAFTIVKLLVYKHQKDTYPVNSIELSNPAVEVDNPSQGEMRTMFRIRTFFRTYDFRTNSSVNTDIWASTIEEKIIKSKELAAKATLQPTNIAPEEVQISLDKHVVSFKQLHKILHENCVDLRIHFNSLESTDKECKGKECGSNWTNITSPHIVRPKRSQSGPTSVRNRVKLGSNRTSTVSNPVSIKK